MKAFPCPFEVVLGQGDWPWVTCLWTWLEWTLPHSNTNRDVHFFLVDGSFQKEFLTTHNTYRQMHQSPPLTLSKDLNGSAQSWANHLLDIGKLKHSSTSDGENTYWMSSSAPINLTGRVRVSVSTLGYSKRLKSLQTLGSTFSCFSASGKEAVESWYGEVKDYEYNSPGFKGNTGNPWCFTVRTTNTPAPHGQLSVVSG